MGLSAGLIAGALNKSILATTEGFGFHYFTKDYKLMAYILTNSTLKKPSKINLSLIYIF